MEERKGLKEIIHTELFAKEKFVGEVEKIFSSLKEHEPFSLGVNMGYLGSPLSVDVEWKMIPFPGPHWSLSQVEFVLSVLTSRQSPNVKETQLSFYNNEFGDISAEVWKLLSKLHNLTHLSLRFNKLSVVSPLIGDLIHLQELYLVWNNISAEGVVGVCELLKVCCSVGYCVGGRAG